MTVSATGSRTQGRLHPVGIYLCELSTQGREAACGVVGQALASPMWRHLCGFPAGDPLVPSQGTDKVTRHFSLHTSHATLPGSGALVSPKRLCSEGQMPTRLLCGGAGSSEAP